MCLFVTALLPESTHIDGAVEVFEKYQIGFKRISNPHVLEQASPGDIYVQTTRHWCDCDTPLGSMARRAAYVAHTGATPQDRISKLRKQGWSEAKIHRWLEDKGQSEEKRERVQVTKDAPRLERWISVISELLRSGYASRIGLLIHFYNDGSLENDRVEFARQEYIPLAELSVEHLLHLERDVVYHYIP